MTSESNGLKQQKPKQQQTNNNYNAEIIYARKAFSSEQRLLIMTNRIYRKRKTHTKRCYLTYTQTHPHARTHARTHTHTHTHVFLKNVFLTFVIKGTLKNHNVGEKGKEISNTGILQNS